MKPCILRVVTIGIVGALAIACGSSHGVHGDGGPPGDGRAPGDGASSDGPASDAGVCGSAVCAGEACGSGSACGQAVTCAMCRYDATAIAASSEPILVATGSGAAPALAVTDGHVVGTRSASGWSTEDVTSASGGTISGTLAGFALATDGTRWLAYVNVSGGAVAVVHGSAAAGWTTELVGTSTIGDSHANLAIAPDGTVLVAFYGSASGTQAGIILARSAGSAGGPWTLSTIVPYTPDLLDDFAMAIDPAGGGQDVAFVWQTATVQYVTASLAGVAGQPETVDGAAAATTSDALSLAFDDAGRPHVAYRHDTPADRTVYHAVRDGGAWTSEQIGDERGSSYMMQIAAAPGGALAIIYGGDNAILLAQHTNGAWLSDPIYGGTCFGRAAIAYVAGQLEAIDDCDGSIVELVRDGVYPADYAATCAHAAAALCSAACGCSSSCCIDYNQGQVCDNPQSNCDQQIALDLCGDHSRDPSALYSCDAAIGMPACGSDSAITAPAACVLR